MMIITAAMRCRSAAPWGPPKRARIFRDVSMASGDPAPRSGQPVRPSRITPTSMSQCWARWWRSKRWTNCASLAGSCPCPALRMRTLWRISAMRSRATWPAKKIRVSAASHENTTWRKWGILLSLCAGSLWAMSFAKLSLAPAWQRPQVSMRFLPATVEAGSVLARIPWALGWSTPFASFSAAPWQSTQAGARADPVLTSRPWIESLKVTTTSGFSPAFSTKAASPWQVSQRFEMAREPGNERGAGPDGFGRGLGDLVDRAVAARAGRAGDLGVVLQPLAVDRGGHLLDHLAVAVAQAR